MKEKYRLARRLGFDNINMDLIIGLPEEDINDVRATMEEIKAVSYTHLDVYKRQVPESSSRIWERTRAQYKSTVVWIS